MHRTPALRPARTCRSAIITTRTARTRGPTIVAALIVPALSRRPTRTPRQRLSRTHGTRINRTSRHRTRRTRRHPRSRRRRGARSCRTLRQPRHHVGARRNHRPRLRLTRQIRLGRRTQRLRWRCRRARRTRPYRLRPQRRWNARQARRGRSRRTRRNHRWRSLRSIAHTSRHRLPRPR
jgi:hypothetical protein